MRSIHFFLSIITGSLPFFTLITKSTAFSLTDNVIVGHRTISNRSTNRIILSHLSGTKESPEQVSWNSRRNFLFSQSHVLVSAISLAHVAVNKASAANFPPLDINNAMAREYTAFPGLYPTIATKLVNAAKKNPFTSKADVYAALDTDIEKERLRMYDSSIQINAVDKALQQFKGSQICKYECGNRVSSTFRDEQIREVQSARSIGN